MIKVTEGDYLEFCGIDLAVELMNQGNDNISRFPDIYIKNVSEFVYDYVNLNYSYAPTNEEAMKKAILHQIQWWLEHGNLSLYNPEKLNVLSPNAYRVLKLAGMANAISWKF